MSVLRTLGREPLVHFVVVGVALFALDRACGGVALLADLPPAAAPGAPGSSAPPAPPTDERRIVVDRPLIDELAGDLERRSGRRPTTAELDAAIESWIDREVLYREALARGLDRDDPVIQQRVADKMGFVVSEEVAVPEPSEAELEAWFAAHRDRWTRPERIDFTHVFVAGASPAAAARADGLLAELERGADPSTMGERFSGGRRYRGRTPAALAAAFGPEFAAGVAGQPLGAWVRRRSRFGLHLVRVDDRAQSAAASFTAARADVRKEWIDAQRAAGVAAALRRLRARWEIVRP